MKHLIKGVIVLIILSLIYIMFNGTPWGKETIRIGTVKYLKGKYGEEMKIDKIEYDFDNSSFVKFNYYAVVSLKKDPQVKFRVSRYDNKFTDRYKLTYWEYEVKNEIKQEFNQISSVMFQLKSDPLVNYSGINLPSYHYVKEAIKIEDRPELWLQVNINDGQDPMNVLLEIVLFLKEKDYKLSSIDFKIIDSASDESYHLIGTDLNNIANISSLTDLLK